MLFFRVFRGKASAKRVSARDTRDEGRRSTPALCYRSPEKREKIAPILQAVIGNYKIPLVFCRAIEEYVSKVTSRLVGWLKSAGTSSITAATLKTAKETLYKTRSNSRHWLNHSLLNRVMMRLPCTLTIESVNKILCITIQMKPL